MTVTPAQAGTQAAVFLTAGHFVRCSKNVTLLPCQKKCVP